MTIDQIISHNKRAGLFFFSAGAMKAFSCKVLDKVFEGVGGTHFVTSEKFGEQRVYKVRNYNPQSGRVYSPGTQNYETSAQAFKEAKRLSEILPENTLTS